MVKSAVEAWRMNKCAALKTIEIRASLLLLLLSLLFFNIGGAHCRKSRQRERTAERAAGSGEEPKAWRKDCVENGMKRGEKWRRKKRKKTNKKTTQIKEMSKRKNKRIQPRIPLGPFLWLAQARKM